MTDAQPTTRLGLTYWPRRSGFGWWRNFDRSELRDELLHVAGLGLSAVRVCLRWEDVQPAPRRVDADVLRSLELALDAAHEAGLKALPVLFPVAIGGGLHLPRWAATPDPLDALRRLARPAEPVVAPSLPPVIYESGYRTNRTRDLFHDETTLEAQRYLVGEVIGYFGSHPAVLGWQLGDGLERAHPPASELAIAEWFSIIADTARRAYPRARLMGTTSARGLLGSAGPRPEAIARSCDVVGVVVDAPLPLRGARPLDLDAVEFFYALAAALAERPLHVMGLGQPTAPNDREAYVADLIDGASASTYLASRTAAAEYIGGALERLARLGALGAWLTAYADYPPGLWAAPPLDRSQRDRTAGLVDAAGREKPLAGVVAQFAAAQQGQKTPQPLPLSVDNDRYWSDPAAECARLWHQFAPER